jgi:hypothetical protein
MLVIITFWDYYIYWTMVKTDRVPDPHCCHVDLTEKLKNRCKTFQIKMSTLIDYDENVNFFYYSDLNYRYCQI